MGYLLLHGKIAVTSLLKVVCETDIASVDEIYTFGHHLKQ